MADGNCSSCGKALATADILYNDRGDIVCSDCSAKADIQSDEKRAANNIKIAGITCLLGAVFGGAAFFVGFGLGFFAAGIISVAAAFFALNGLAGPGAAKFVAYLSPTAKSIAWTTTAIGIAIDVFVMMCWGDVIHIRPLWMR